MSDFDKQVCRDCLKATGDRWWSDAVISWFIRMDFIPAVWQEDYLAYVKEN